MCSFMSFLARGLLISEPPLSIILGPRGSISKVS